MLTALRGLRGSLYSYAFYEHWYELVLDSGKYLTNILSCLSNLVSKKHDSLSAERLVVLG